MKQYKIYENRAGNREAVKQGWSWPAFFFTFIWAFIKKMNAIGGGLLAGYFILLVFVGALAANDEDTAATVDGLGGLVNIAIIVIFGVNGNAWREKNLVTRAYEYKGTVAAETDEAAISSYIEGTKPDNVRQ